MSREANKQSLEEEKDADQPLRENSLKLWEGGSYYIYF